MNLIQLENEARASEDKTSFLHLYKGTSLRVVYEGRAALSYILDSRSSRILTRKQASNMLAKHGATQ